MKAKICLQKETDIDKWSIACISTPLFSRSLRLLSSEKITGNSTEQMAKYIYLNLEFNNQTCESITPCNEIRVRFNRTELKLFCFCLFNRKNLQVTLEGMNGSKAKHNNASWNVFFHSLVPVSAFHKINDDGAWSATSRSWQASWVPSHSKSSIGLFPSENSATDLPWGMSQTMTLPAASPDASRRT